MNGVYLRARILGFVYFTSMFYDWISQRGTLSQQIHSLLQNNLLQYCLGTQCSGIGTFSVFGENYIQGPHIDNCMFEGLNVKKSNIFGSIWFINSATSTTKLSLTLGCLKLHNMKVKDLLFSSRLSF